MKQFWILFLYTAYFFLLFGMDVIVYSGVVLASKLLDGAIIKVSVS